MFDRYCAWDATFVFWNYSFVQKVLKSALWYAVGGLGRCQKNVPRDFFSPARK